MKENESLFPFIYLHLLAFICKQFSLRLYPRLGRTLSRERRIAPEIRIGTGDANLAIRSSS
jgi:hypothetical protein